jgi:two-component system, OmpR family, phosphate regulon sensor histidine kinase PhoR
MPRRPLLWHLFPSYALVALAAMIGAGWVAVVQFENSYLNTTRADLLARADFLDSQLGPEISEDRRDFCRFFRRYHQASGIRVALILPSGKVECDSEGRPEELENQRARPEIQRALDGTADHALRYNAGLDQRVIYTAVPLLRDDRLFGVLYLSMPLAALDQAIWHLEISLAIVGLAIIGLSGAWAWWVASGITRPIVQIQRAANRLGSGHWGTRVALADQQELAELAEAFNRTAGQLQQQIGVLTQNNNEQKAVLASMAEGVLAVDSQERVISLNSASGRLLGLEQSQAQGRPLQEVVRNADLSRFISRALASPDPIESDVLLHGDRQRVMQAHGSALHDLGGRAIGAVIVLNDVTDFRRLEHIRRDFVANVSHELKTPVTSIKGFVETLLDGAMNDPQDAERFLRIIAKQADRLHAIIEDLLSLSKIEQSEDSDDIALQTVPLRGVLESAINTCQSISRERNIEVALDCGSQIQARINNLLFEQAVVNLLDNAIKYSDPGREVLLSACEAAGELTIRVTDHGCGIAGEHVSRIFERFYRVDRARSRKLGGTGLGLAIVKHIVQAHRGHVSVESTLGIGSTFSIHLPAVGGGDQRGQGTGDREP